MEQGRTDTMVLVGSLLLTVSILQTVGAVNTRLDEVFSWNSLQFQFSSKEEEKAALESGRYVPQNNLPLGLERWMDRLFITVPRYKPGVYSTLNYIQLDSKNQSKSPLLVPYPSAEQNTVGERRAWPPRLHSVPRVRADSCDRLWVIDLGSIDIATQPKQITSPKIIVYDLKTDTLVNSYTLKDKTDYTERSRFPTITVDVTSANCDQAYAYLPDVYNYNLVVYNLLTNETHVVTHNYFHFDPLSGDFSSNGLSWQWQDGIFGLALSPVDRDGFRLVYFHSLASTMEFVVTSKYLQNTSLITGHPRAFKVLGNRGLGGQSSSSFLDEETGVLFFTMVNKHAIGCWNSFKGDEYDSAGLGVVAEDEDTISFPSDLKVDKQGSLWILVSPQPQFLFSKLDPKAVNFRVFKAPVRQAIKGTVCDEM